MSPEIVISLALVFACVVLILIHPRGREASVAVGAAIALYWLTRKKPAPIVPTDPKIEPPEINYAETHKMDDDTMPKPAATHSAQQLRDWAGSPDNVRDEE